MKKILIPILLFVGIAGFIACQKENSSDPMPVQSLKTEGIKKGEPVLFSVNNPSGQAAQWNVTPATNVQVTPNGNNATILFRKAGSYLVTASMGNATARTTVNVIDSFYCDSTGHCDTTIIDTCRYGNCSVDSIFVPLTGDEIHITLSKIDSGSNSGLVINAKTKNKYPCPVNFLLSTAIYTSGSYNTEFLSVSYTGNCTGGQAPAQSLRHFYPIPNGIPDGTHGFKVLLNGVTYSGSFTKTGNQYSFNWPYSSGVTISPQNL